jgi:hypothetical protein
MGTAANLLVGSDPRLRTSCQQWKSRYQVVEWREHSKTRGSLFPGFFVIHKTNGNYTRRVLEKLMDAMKLEPFL